MNKKFKCTFCDSTIAHIGEKEVEAGWGKIEGHIEGKEFRLIHCPLHFEEFKVQIVPMMKKVKKKKSYHSVSCISQIRLQEMK